MAASLGYDGVEVMVWTDPVSQDLSALKGLAEHYGVRIGSIHAPCLLVTQRVWMPDPWQRLRGGADVAKQPGRAARGGAPAVRLATRLRPQLRLRAGPVGQAVPRCDRRRGEHVPGTHPWPRVRAVRAGLGSHQGRVRRLHAGPVALRRGP